MFLISAEQLTGYKQKRSQIRWLKARGFTHWHEQRENGKIVVFVREFREPEPHVKLNLAAIGRKTKDPQTPSGEHLRSQREVSAKAS